MILTETTLKNYTSEEYPLQLKVYAMNKTDSKLDPSTREKAAARNPVEALKCK